MSEGSTAIPLGASAAVLKPSEPVPDAAVSVEGPDFDKDVSLAQLLDSYKRIGFQASSLAKAIEIVNKMVCRPSISAGHSLNRVVSANGGSPTSLSRRTSLTTIALRK